jgi:hypothetical protein
MALACFLFLLWRAGSSLVFHGEKFASPLGTQLDALRWSETRRINATVAALEREAQVEPGYLGEMFAALAELPPAAKVYVYAGAKDPRRRAVTRLQYLLYPREVKPLLVRPSAALDDGQSCLLSFAADGIEGEAIGLRSFHVGPDWTLWSQ